MTSDHTLNASLRRYGRLALIVGAVGLAITLIGGIFGLGNFFQSYLLAYLFCLGLSLGSIVLLFVQHLAGGSWGAMVMRPLEAASMVLPVLALLFIPLLFGLGHLFDWTSAEYLVTHPTVAAKTEYLNIPFFIIRAVIYFAIWIYGAFYFVRGSVKQDESAAGSRKIADRLRGAGAPWIIIYVMTMTFAGIDWGMSLTPTWFSGIYSVILMSQQTITAMALLIGVMVLLASLHPSIDEILTSKRLQDLGNFLMAFLLFWAYVSFSQLIIIWSNNTVETSSWYVVRFHEPWRALSGFLLFFGFFAPFAVLFSRWVKRKRLLLTLTAAYTMLISLIHLFWVIVPTFDRSGFQLQFLDIAALVGLSGIWLAAFASQLRKRPLLPLHDPRLSTHVLADSHTEPQASGVEHG